MHWVRKNEVAWFGSNKSGLLRQDAHVVGSATNNEPKRFRFDFHVKRGVLISLLLWTGLVQERKKTRALTDETGGAAAQAEIGAGIGAAVDGVSLLFHHLVKMEPLEELLFRSVRMADRRYPAFDHDLSETRLPDVSLESCSWFSPFFVFDQDPSLTPLQKVERPEKGRPPADLAENQP